MYPLIRSLLFRMEAEAAHEFVARQIVQLQQIPIVLTAIERMCRPPLRAQTRLLGLTFSSPVGIAAGFDKNAAMMPMLAALGFGFIEVGTVTLRPQPGNPRPRLFRYAEQKALINRLGFNNDGAHAVAERLKAFDRRVPVFVNVGRNRDGAVEDYAACYGIVAPHADAAVLNVSSPNTPGLRDLQKPDDLERLLRSIPKVGPVLVKIAPDLDATQIAEIAAVCAKLADGMICTNTTVDHRHEAGGLSGAPLKARATAVLAKVREHVGRDYPLIGVGGVFSAADVREKIAAGANLVQLYTSFIYEGPALPRRLTCAL
jgi:dihydroorotate dehydrogenase